MEQIIREFQELRDLEEKARNYYRDALSTITDPEVREVLASIMRDEEFHMQSADEILSLLRV